MLGVKQWKSDGRWYKLAVCSKLNQYVQMNAAVRGMRMNCWKYMVVLLVCITKFCSRISRNAGYSCAALKAGENCRVHTYKTDELHTV